MHYIKYSADLLLSLEVSPAKIIYTAELFKVENLAVPNFRETVLDFYWTLDLIGPCKNIRIFINLECSVGCWWKLSKKWELSLGSECSPQMPNLLRALY